MTTDEEEKAARLLGERIGFGRMMQLGQKLWRESLGDLRGGEFSIGPCVATLVPCPHPDKTEHCDWCCGSGHVTKRVLAEMLWSDLESAPRDGSKFLALTADFEFGVRFNECIQEARWSGKTPDDRAGHFKSKNGQMVLKWRPRPSSPP